MENRIITMARQFGSGGREIGEMVAKALEIPLYDRTLIELASKKLGIDEFDLEQIDETAINRFLASYQTPDETLNSMTGYGLPLNDSMYLAQCEILHKLAEKGPCVIIGRCADVVLGDRFPCVNVFITASKEDRIQRIAKRYAISEREAAEAVRRVDRKRRYYYETYTKNEWGKIGTYQAMFNVSQLGMAMTAAAVQGMYLNLDQTE